ncbi:unnamed protein product [Ilex paraguariensis]|uniref:Diacylglycerol O-acyltransferase n=1 Tax=Ilex paraguariensis TaxID=185542 RepID=A0ABC8S3U6_9AQUA
MRVVDNKKQEKMRWSRTRVDVENHVTTPDLDPDMESPDQFVEDYISDLTKTSMEISNKPLGEFHILNVQTSEVNALAILRIHHSLSDGASLISILLACSWKTSKPEALPSILAKKQGSSSSHSGGLWWFLFTVWTTLVMIFNTFMDLMVFVATTLFLKDKETPIKGAVGVELRPKRIVYRLLSLNDIKLVQNAMNMVILFISRFVMLLKIILLKIYFGHFFFLGGEGERV